MCLKAARVRCGHLALPRLQQTLSMVATSMPGDVASGMQMNAAGKSFCSHAVVPLAKMKHAKRKFGTCVQHMACVQLLLVTAQCESVQMGVFLIAACRVTTGDIPHRACQSSLAPQGKTQ